MIDPVIDEPESDSEDDLVFVEASAQKKKKTKKNKRVKPFNPLAVAFESNTSFRRRISSSSRSSLRNDYSEHRESNASLNETTDNAHSDVQDSNGESSLESYVNRKSLPKFLSIDLTVK